MNKDLEKQKELNDSLIDNAQHNDEVIHEVGGDNLKYCKRVKYLEKAWILVCKQQNYYWIDQDSIPINKLQTINVEELEENQYKLQ